jgi:hypothetical protein
VSISAPPGPSPTMVIAAFIKYLLKTFLPQRRKGREVFFKN